MADSPRSDTRYQQAADRLRAAGARVLVGAISDSSGVLRCKAVPAARIESFARSGMGASLTWPVFCVDNGIAFTEQIGVTGDLRLTADLDAAVVVDEGFAWAPADVRDQQGELSPLCWRSVARDQEARLAALGITALIGHEMELFLTDLDGNQLGAELGWPCYGLGAFSELSGFASDLVERLAEVGIDVEQIHAEYGTGQFELSLPPAPPLRAADNVLLARTVLGRVARQHGMRASFSPMPFEGGSGNGAHLHISFQRDGQPLLSGGDGPAGLTPDGEHAIAGVLDDLPATIAVLAGTPVSGDRLHPGHWSGAAACWGPENREAALRLIEANNGNPHGANIEVKCVDGGANPYLATGLLLGLAADGIARRAEPYAPVVPNPADLTKKELKELRVRPLPHTAADRISAFATNDAVRTILGDQLHAAIVAVRELEARSFDGKDAYALTRFAWSA